MPLPPHQDSQETLYGDFRLLEQECKNLEKAQSKTQNTEESLTQLMHMHHRALAHLKNAEKSIDGLKDDLKDAHNGDWYFWDFVNELHCGICNKDLNGAYSLACRDTFHGTCLWQWFEENVHEHIINTALRQVKGEPRPFVMCPVCLSDVQEGPFYNRKVVNLLQMLDSEEE
ncbi:hypothetical protein EDD18DRAFT_1109853 [Armillaria luteobubalina]|uniref:RING-type domain-containing protein n=1 Tax=Armillaria luteobubalina TaxID=153913 RepID=A0AA39PSZ3_9AGAR|nr:hypothetical protein EDD18DRAFT_1109853 [Armillaria luteobubalina]